MFRTGAVFVFCGYFSGVAWRLRKLSLSLLMPPCNIKMAALLDPKPNPRSSCKHAIILCYYRLAEKKVTRDKKSLVLCFTRLLYVWNTLVGPGRHPRYTRAPACGGRPWVGNSVRNRVEQLSVRVEQLTALMSGTVICKTTVSATVTVTV